MRKFVPTALVAGLVVIAAAQGALAGELVDASGPVKVNGKQVTLPVKIAANDRIETGGSTATFKSDAGDVVLLEPRTVAKSEGAEGGIEYLFVETGAAVGTITDKTTIGVSVSWATAPKGQSTQVRVEAPADRPATEGRFRSIAGDTWLRNGSDAVWLPAAHSVTLWRDRQKPGSLCFRTSQQNAGKVEMNRTVSGGNIVVRVPRAASGCIQDHEGNKTKISNDLTSNKQEKVDVATEFGTASSAAIGPGTFAIIDNQTGGIEVIDETIDESVGEEIPDFDPVDNASDASVSRRTKR